jgi:prevent-host-death family protein
LYLVCPSCTLDLYRKEARVRKVKVTDLRNALPAYLKAVQAGEELTVESRGKVIARIVPERSAEEGARQRLQALRAKARVGDVVSPTEEHWDAES